MRSEILFEAHVEVGEILSMGDTGKGDRRVIAITGGSFSGSGMTGRILPGGADWQLVRHDGIAEIEARYVLETDDGIRIQIRSEGVRHGPPAVMAALARGETPDPESYYFRTALRFEAPAGRLAWLNGVIGFAVAERLPRGVRFAAYRVL